MAEDPALRRFYLDELERVGVVGLDRFQRRAAVMDTTSNPTLLPLDALLAFYEGIVRLGRREPDALFLLKPKNPLAGVLAATERGRRVHGEIEAAPNVAVLPNTFETAAVVALSELVISACLTSTVVEAIGCGTPAIYYDAVDGHPAVFRRRIPGMVCVSDEQLAERVHHLLWDCEPATYAEYLPRHCLALEGFFDGLAIARFRKRLAAELRG